jgi:hypothetical protein
MIVIYKIESELSGMKINHKGLQQILSAGKKGLKSIIIGSIGLALTACYVLIFGKFFPIVKGGLGHDFTLGLPQLLSGYFWFRNNGLSSVFWFSPFICGGVPAFPHPIHFFYSLPQFLSFLVDPFSAVILNFIIFAAAGFWGHYFLVRRLFATNVSIALLCATLFLFNGFYVYRYIIGHFLFHSFMLVPWCVLLLTDPGRDNAPGRLRKNAGACAATALLISYMVHSTLQNLMPPVMLSIVVACLICGLAMGRRFSIGTWTKRFICACALALAISAAKLSALYHFLSHVPRTGYSLPQFTRLSDLLYVLFHSLFFSPAWERARQSMTNLQFTLKRHEFEFGLTFVPLVILCAGGLYFLIAWGIARRQKKRCGLNARTMSLLMVVLSVLTLPIALNYYTPGWNRFLKTVPVIGSSTQCTRWFCMYIPVITLLTAIVAQKTPFFRRFRVLVAIIGIGCILFVNLNMNKSYYHQETYSPLPIMAMYYKVKKGQWDPVITDIGVCTDEFGRPGMPVFRNDSLIFGQSQLLCYDSAFGYMLENLPMNQLSPGSVFKEKDGFLNIKNPACYVFPEANGCLPGDQFRVEEKDKVVAFTHYRPYDFKMPLAQKIADYVSLGGLFISAVLLGWYVIGGGLVFWRRKTGSTVKNQARSR